MNAMPLSGQASQRQPPQGDLNGSQTSGPDVTARVFAIPKDERKALISQIEPGPNNTMKIKSAHYLATVGALLGLAVAPAAYAHQTYNVGTLNGPPATATGWTYSVGPNYGNGIDGAINSSQGGAPIDPANMVWRSGVGAVTPEYTGNLPEMWYSGLHNTALSYTRREIGTVSGGANGTTFTTPGSSLDARIATWNATAGLPAGQQLDPNSQIAVKGNSWLTGDGLDYGVSHVSCSTGAGTPAENCLADGNQTISWTLKNLNSLSTSLLGIAVYGGWDTSATSNRTALFNGTALGGLNNPQGSTLGIPLWSAVMTNPTDVLTYRRYFNLGEADLYNGEYTVIIGALNSTGDGQYYLSNTFGVPAPATLWLFGIGFGAMSVFSRRKSSARLAD